MEKTEKIDIPRIIRWTKKGSLAVLDQALFSGANFIVNILLARWLPPEEYGAFAVAMSIFYLLASLHTAVITEPMMVFGAGKYREHFKKYLGMLLWGHWAVSALIALALGISALFFIKRGSPMGEALLGLAVASPFLLLLWLTRRACYTNFKQGWAVGASGINLLATLLGIILLWKVGTLSTLTGIVALGVAAGVASFMLTSFHLRPQVVGYSGNPTPRMVLVDHWGYGSWNLTGVIAYWASGQILMLLIPIFLGLSASATIAAIWNLYRPVGLLTQSLGLVLLPVFSKWISSRMSNHIYRLRVMRFSTLFSLIVALYTLFLSINSGTILNYIYDGKYNLDWILVALFGISMTISMATGILMVALKALGKIAKVTSIWVITSATMIIIGVPLLLTYDILGALVSLILNNLLAFVIAKKNIL